MHKIHRRVSKTVPSTTSWFRQATSLVDCAGRALEERSQGSFNAPEHNDAQFQRRYRCGNDRHQASCCAPHATELFFRRGPGDSLLCEADLTSRSDEPTSCGVGHISCSTEWKPTGPFMFAS